MGEEEGLVFARRMREQDEKILRREMRFGGGGEIFLLKFLDSHGINEQTVKNMKQKTA
jgi:hypothetical protein